MAVGGRRLAPELARRMGSKTMGGVEALPLREFPGR